MPESERDVQVVGSEERRVEQEEGAFMQLNLILEYIYFSYKNLQTDFNPPTLRLNNS